MEQKMEQKTEEKLEKKLEKGLAGHLPVTVARLKENEVYNVVSGSMEPEIPVGSVIYVEPVPPETAPYLNCSIFMIP